MEDKWYYRASGQEAGPVTFDELKKLVQAGTLRNEVEVRQEEATEWKLATSVEEFKFVSAPIVEKTMPAVEDSVVTQVATQTAAAPAAPSAPPEAEEWYCKVQGRELGPASLEELIRLATHGLLNAGDAVKQGANGKWRRANTFSELAKSLPAAPTKPAQHAAPSAPASAAAPNPAPTAAAPVAPTPAAPATATAATSAAAAAPYAPAPTATASSSKSATKLPPATPAASTAAAAPAVPAPPKPPALSPAAIAAIHNAETLLAKAKIAYATKEQIATQMIVWTTAPTCDQQWWALIEGVPEGPVNFMDIFGWVKSGRLQLTDYVRNGMYGQYAPASSVPGLLQATELLKQANEEIRAAVAAVETAKINATAPPPVEKPRAVAAAVPGPTGPKEPKPQAHPTLNIPSPSEVPSRPVSTPVGSGGSSGNYAASVLSKPPAARPMASPAKASSSSRKSSSSESNELLETLMTRVKDPKVMGIIGVSFALLLIVGWLFTSGSNRVDIERYRALKGLLDEVREKREAKDTDFSELKTRAGKLTKEYAPLLEKEADNNHPAKQALLWAVKDELPRMMAKDLTVESESESNFAQWLENAANYLGVE